MKPFGRWPLCAVLPTMLLSLALTGCMTAERLRGEGFRAETADLGGTMRSPGSSDGEAWSLSTKGRQVERSLGY